MNLAGLGLDPTKPFYPLVLAYLVQRHGLMEILTRGLAMENPSPAHSPKEASGIKDPAHAAAFETLLCGKITTLVGVQQLGSVISAPIPIVADELAGECAAFFTNGGLFRRFREMSIGSLLIAAHAVAYDSMNKGGHLKQKMWEFLRHCRNAAAHGGRFHFDRDEPKRPAKWRSLEIKRTMQGDPLLRGEPQQNGFLENGDVLYLLADLEVKFPAIQ